MIRTPFYRACLAGIVISCAGGVTGTMALAAQTEQSPDPLDATAPVPPTTYQSTLSGSERRYLQNTDVERLPWRHLFTPDGRFAAEPAAVGETRPRPAASSVPKRSMQSMHSAPLTATQSTGDVPSDARGVIKSIDEQQNKVKLKHGPIEKFDMPGMTMVFRVKDPGLLKQVQKGDEVGVTVEMDRGAMYITGFQK